MAGLSNSAKGISRIRRRAGAGGDRLLFGRSHECAANGRADAAPRDRDDGAGAAVRHRGSDPPQGDGGPVAVARAHGAGGRQRRAHDPAGLGRRRRGARICAITFIEDAPSKNKALQSGNVDFVWETVDELPISLGGFKAASVDARAFLQIDWSRGGDACVASQGGAEGRGHPRPQVGDADVLARPHGVRVHDHQLAARRPSRWRRSARTPASRWTTSPSAASLFAQGKVDVACLWEPDVTLALASRPGRAPAVLDRRRHRAGGRRAAGAQGVPRYAPGDWRRSWRASGSPAVKQAEADRPAAARLISTVCSALPRRAGLRRDAGGVRVGEVDRPRRQRPLLRPRRQAARVRPRLQPGRRHLDQLSAGGDQGALRARHAARRPRRPPNLGGRGASRSPPPAVELRAARRRKAASRCSPSR